MAKNSKIQWTDHTFNPWRGCTKVAPGCANCYADALAQRFPDTHGMWGPNGRRVVAAESTWREPIKWNESAPLMVECDNPECRDRRIVPYGLEETFCPVCGDPGGNTVRPRVFCASLADVFEDWAGKIYNARGEVMLKSYAGDLWDTYDETLGPWEEYPDKQGYQALTMADVRARLFKLIDATPHLDWLLVTKRPENIRQMWPSYHGPGDVVPSRLENVWLLTSVACQADVDKNLPHLLKCRDLVPVLGVSAEPLIGEIDLGLSTAVCDCCPRWPTRWISLPREVRGDFPVGHTTAAKPGIYRAEANRHGALSVTATDGKKLGIKPAECAPLGPIDWVIAGGESGKDARPCDVRWIESIRDQCQVAGVPCFVKQLGANPVATPVPGYTTGLASLEDNKGGNPDEWPEDLRVREFPEVSR